MVAPRGRRGLAETYVVDLVKVAADLLDLLLGARGVEVKAVADGGCGCGPWRVSASVATGGGQEAGERRRARGGERQAQLTVAHGVLDKE